MMSLTQGQKVDAGTWAQFTKAFASSHTDTLDSIVRNGYAQGQTVAQMATQMRQVTDGLLKVQAETLARTGVQHYAVNAREAMFLDNDVDEVVYNATLDNRTTSLCAGRDGKRWKMTDPKRPALPAHYGCRSQWIPAIAMQDIETRAAVGGQKGAEAAELFEEKQDRTDKKVKYKGRKDSEIFKAGQVQYTTYDKWLEKQPKWFVESALGKERAELFLSGKVSISQFNDLSGRPLTLAQLRALDGD
jgi:SPP1 gp7 family putative phage head morphogenesis protein